MHNERCTPGSVRGIRKPQPLQAGWRRMPTLRWFLAGKPLPNPLLRVDEAVMQSVVETCVISDLHEIIDTNIARTATRGH